MIGITVNEAGRMGGLSLLNKRGPSHFAEIGKKGQEAMRKRYPGMAVAWGKKGGRPRKNNL
ncbi:MAG: stress-induced protein, KGG, repeat-containing protein [Chloroflexota bacterium]